MFHAFDNDGPGKVLSRPEWMALLARAPLAMMESVLGRQAVDKPLWLRAPQTGLMMVQGRAGATGERFNLGEVTVTRCALRLVDVAKEPLIGVAYVLGRSYRQVHLAAVADALLQDPAQHAVLETALLQPLRQFLAEQRATRQNRAQSTKVEFFTVAREAGDENNEEQDE
jgi:alpha-D-ribose 1-methylphosphonate 5-triphosphate synthase subunit PhnG